MAQFIVPPVKDLRDSQNDVQVPVSYSNSNGLGLFLSRLDVSRGTGIERTITRDQFISGNYDFSLPSGYVPVPYQLPLIEPKNVILKSDTAICYMPVTKYIIGSPSAPLTGAIKFKMNKTPITQGGVTFNPFIEGQIYIVSVHVSNATIDWVNSDFGVQKYTNNYYRNVSKWNLRFYFDGSNVILLDVNEGRFYSAGMDSVPVGSNVLLSNMLLEIYNLANRGATGVAGGDLAGNYPNPVIGSRKVTGAKIALEGVGYENMAQNSVGNYNLRTDSVQSNVIQNGSVTNIKIALGTITGDRIVNQTITEQNIVRSTITALSLAAGAVGTDQIKDENVTNGKVAPLAITESRLGNAAVTKAKIASKAVGFINLEEVVSRLIQVRVVGFTLDTRALTTRNPTESGIISPNVTKDGETYLIRLLGGYYCLNVMACPVTMIGGRPGLLTVIGATGGAQAISINADTQIYTEVSVWAIVKPAIF